MDTTKVLQRRQRTRPHNERPDRGNAADASADKFLEDSIMATTARQNAGVLMAAAVNAGDLFVGIRFSLEDLGTVLFQGGFLEDITGSELTDAIEFVNNDLDLQEVINVVLTAAANRINSRRAAGTRMAGT
jgi:hypothetical protein